MAINASKVKTASNRIEQPNLEPGPYPARLVQIIDLGLQPQRPYKGVEKPPAHELMVTYELSDAFMIDKEGNDLEDKPRWVSETFPLNNISADLAKSTKRYVAFDPNISDGGDWSKQIGKPCTVNIINNESKGKVYDNVDSVAPMRARDAAKLPELVNPSRVFDLDNPDMEVFNSFPDWIKEKITSNLTFSGSLLEGLLKGAPAKDQPQRAEAPQDEQDGDEDCPF